jgi:hypothetical protein
MRRITRDAIDNLFAAWDCRLDSVIETAWEYIMKDDEPAKSK